MDGGSFLVKLSHLHPHVGVHAQLLLVIGLSVQTELFLPLLLVRNALLGLGQLQGEIYDLVKHLGEIRLLS